MIDKMSSQNASRTSGRSYTCQVLIRFEASNFRSISNPVELSMVAVDRDREEARAQPRIGESLLPVTAIYGPNASGKSNVISALTWLCDAVSSSLRLWEDKIPVEPFAFDEGLSKNSEFTVDLVIDGVRFEYIVELNSDRVVYEGLFHHPEKRPRRIFEREGTELKIQRGLGGISGTRELLTDQTLALSIARRFNEPLVDHFARKILQTQTLGQSHGRLQMGRFRRPRSLANTIQMFEERPQMSLFDNESVEPSIADPFPRDQALALLKLADLGIDDVLVEREEVRNGSAPGDSYTRLQVRMLHQTSSGPTPLDLRVESEGTRTWFDLIGPTLRALRSGSLLLFDELDASLHPTLSAQLLRLFQNPSTNPLGAQLIFTSHDTSLLNHLNRDEVWLTSKGTDGSTRLGALAEFAGERVRKSQNLENAYLHGRFGALPEVDQTDFLRALGLIG
jgi:hypothetical protein